VFEGCKSLFIYQTA